MLNFCSKLIGEDPKRVATYQPSSQRKVRLYATLVCIPVTLWFISTLLLVRNVLGHSWLPAIVAAIVAAGLVYLLEVSIIMAKGNRTILVMRVILGVLAAILGSLSLDEVVFHEDINRQLQATKAIELRQVGDTVMGSFDQQVKTQEDLVNTKYKAWQSALAEATGEADGSRGSGIRKVGKIARMKLQVAKDKEEDYQTAQEDLKAMQEDRGMAINQAHQAVENRFDKVGLLDRIEALCTLIWSRWSMTLLYFVFTLFLLALELTVVIFKLFSEPSVDEQLEALRDQLSIRRAEDLFGRMHEYYPTALSSPLGRKALSVIHEQQEALIKL